MSLFSLLAQTTTQNTPQDLGSFTPPTEAYSTGSDTNAGAFSNFEAVLSNVIGFITVLGALFFVIYFIIGAIQWITSGGDKGKVEKARNQMMNGTIGMIVMIAPYALLGLISSLIGFDLLNPGEALETLVPN